MKVAALFAGIGGIELGLHRAGHETGFLCEVLPTARAVLRSRFTDSELVGDIRELSALPGEADLVSAGFPCQDLSQAGMTAGLDGRQSSLVAEVFRLLAGPKRRELLLENVPFMLQLAGGDAMRRIVYAIEDLGCRWAWRVIDTFGFGLPQRRERVFLLASRRFDPADVLLADDMPIDRPATAIGQRAHGFYWTEGRGGLGWAPDAIPTLKNGSTIGIASPPAILLPSGSIIKPDIRDAERLQGFDEDWTLPAEHVGRPSLRWGLVGSAVSVPAAEWIGKRLTAPGYYDHARDSPFPVSGKLPRAARFDGRKRYSVRVGTDPVGAAPQPLAAFLRHAGEPLSERATSGFLARTRQAKLRFPDGFIDAVAAHLRSVNGDSFRYRPTKRVA